MSNTKSINFTQLKFKCHNLVEVVSEITLLSFCVKKSLKAMASGLNFLCLWEEFMFVSLRDDHPLFMYFVQENS